MSDSALAVGSLPGKISLEVGSAYAKADLDAFLWCLFVRFNLMRDTIEVRFLSAVFPSPPGPLLPTNSGLACLRWWGRSSEFAGSGGAIALLLASLSEVNAIGLAALAAQTTPISRSLIQQSF